MNQCLVAVDEVNCPERALFLWALLFNRKELSLIFWKVGKDHIGGALTAAMIMKSLAKVANSEEELDLAHELLKNAE